MRGIPYSSPRFLMKFVMLTLCALLFMAFPSSLVGVQEVHAQKVYSVTLNPIADAYVKSDEPDTNFGGINSLDLYYYFKNYTSFVIKNYKYSYLMFDLKSIPEGSIIKSAQLKLYAYNVSATMKVDAHFCWSSWSELEVTWKNAPSFSLPATTGVNVGASGWHTWNITSDVSSALSSRKLTEVLTPEHTEEGSYSTSFWSREGSLKPELIINYTLGPYSVDVSISGLPFPSLTNLYVDGVKVYTLGGGSSKTFKFDAETAHTISVDEGVPVKSDTRYYCLSNNWRVSGAGSNIFNYTLQFYLKVDSNPSLPNLVKLSTWINNGAKKTLLGENISDTDTRHIFLSWTVDESKVKENPITIEMNSPHTAIANYKTQHYLTVKSEYGSPVGEGWYDAGSNATISIESQIPTSDWSGALGGKYVFSGWTGDLTSSDASTTIVVDKSKTVTATWRADYTMPYTILGLTVAIAGVLLFILIHFISSRTLTRWQRKWMGKP